MSARWSPHGPLGMGGAPLGNLFDRVSEPDAIATVQAAWDAGIRHYDTAPHYGAGLSEHRMGTILWDKPREAFTLSTKVGRMLIPVDHVPEVAQGFTGAMPFVRRFDYSAAAARRSIEDSLHRLGLSRIDIVYIHDLGEDWHGPAWEDQLREALTGAAVALTELRREGVIRAWGLGVNRIEPCFAALEHTDPDLFLVAGRYTLLDHTALPKLFPACAAKGARVVIGGPYNSGLLAGGATFNYETAAPEMAAKARAMGEICTRHGVDLRSAALQFCAAHPVVAAVIPGARTPAEVSQNAALMNAPILGAVWAELKSQGLLPQDVPTP